MDIRKATKATLVFVVLPTFTAIVGGYIVELIKGTPPGEIMGALGRLFGAVLGGAITALLTALRGAGSWLEAPASVPRWLMLLLTLGAIATLGRAISRMRARIAFEPTPIQRVALTVLSQQYPNEVELGRLHKTAQQLEHTAQSLMGAAHIEQEMEGLRQAGIIRIWRVAGENSKLYGFTNRGRNWDLDRRRSSASDIGPASVEAYWSAVRSLTDRYLRDCVGSAVHWRAWVAGVVSQPDGTTVLTLHGHSGGLTPASVRFPSNLRGDVLNLRTGERIGIIGRIEQATLTQVVIAALRYELE